MEELRAKLASVFMANELDIPADIPPDANYIEGWLQPLDALFFRLRRMLNGSPTW